MWNKKANRAEEGYGNYNNVGGTRDNSGFTLWEVLLALVLAGIMLSLALRLMTEQWRISRELKAQLEVQYAVLVAGQEVSKAIRSADTVEWAAPAVLRVLPWPDSETPTVDSYYVADKDRDGVSDLYREHLKVPNPMASYITVFNCTEVEPGLWQVSIKARIGTQEATWEGKVRQHTHSVSVMANDMSTGILLCWSWFYL